MHVCCSLLWSSLRPINSVHFWNFMLYYFITWWIFYSECWCNGLLKCVPFTCQRYFGVQIYLNKVEKFTPYSAPVVGILEACAGMLLLHQVLELVKHLRGRTTDGQHDYRPAIGVAEVDVHTRVLQQELGAPHVALHERNGKRGNLENNIIHQG